jgi:ubiquinone/menaquinone biosynthesis C-methylase UbiE
MYNEGEDFKEHEKQIAEMVKLIHPHVQLGGKVVLNVGAGLGMHCSFIQALGCAHLYETDIIDYENIYDCSFRKLLLEKHRRSGYAIDLKRVTFIKTSAMDLLFKNDFFDMVFSVNAFEHIPSPSQALSEIIRCLKPGGYGFLTFDPVYFCDTGGHMFSFVKIPWGHLIYSEDEYVKMMRSSGASDSDVDDFLHAMNKKNIRDFREIFSDAEKKFNLSIISRNEWAGVEDPSHLEDPTLKLLRSRYSDEDLLTRGMNVLFRKGE